MKSVNVHQDFFKIIRRHSAEEIGMLFLALASDIDGGEMPENIPTALEVVRELVTDQNDRFSKQQAEKRKPKEPTQPNEPKEPTQPTITIAIANPSNNDNADALSCPARSDDPPDEKASSSPKKTTLSKRQQAQFELFWSKYPRRVKRGAAEKSWAKISPDELLAADIVLAVGKAKLHDRRFKDPQYVPMPSTWLNDKGWLDDYSEIKSREPPKKKSSSQNYAQHGYTNEDVEHLVSELGKGADDG